MDVLDPLDYKNIKHPTPNGLSTKTLIQTIMALLKDFNIVGLGITEFVPDKKGNDIGLYEISQITNLFS